MRAPARLARVAAVASLVAVLAVGCGWFGDDEPRVLVVGDSVTEQSSTAIREAFDWADPVDIRAHSGFRTDELLGTARDGVDASPDIGVFMTGYNDVIQEREDTSALEEMMDLAAELPCAVWLLLPAFGGFDPARTDAWDDEVRALAEERDVAVVSDWKDLVEGSPGFTFLSEQDAVHPNEEGRKAIARVMESAADEECR